MTTRRRRWAAAASALLTLSITSHAVSAHQKDWLPGPASWQEDLTPVTAADWSYGRAEQLLGRAGFSDTPEEIQKLVDMTPEQAVRSLVDYNSISNDHLQPFVHSGFWEALLHGPEQIADLPVPVAESPGAVRIGHPERSHLVEYLAPNSVFNSLPRQRSSPHLRPDDRLVTIDRVLHHASLGVA